MLRKLNETSFPKDKIIICVFRCRVDSFTIDMRLLSHMLMNDKPVSHIYVH